MATNTQPVSILTEAIVTEMVSRHMRPGISARKVIIGQSGQTAKIFFDGITGRAPKSGAVAFMPSDGGYVFCYGNTVQQASFGDTRWTEWLSRQGR